MDDITTEEQRRYVWKKLTGMNIFLEGCSIKCIASGVWKYTHRLVATNINTRPQGSEKVTKEDLDIVYWMNEGVAINWFQFLTRKLKYMSITGRDKSNCLGCTSIIRNLFWNERVNFERELDRYQESDLIGLEKMQMYESRADKWIHQPVLPQPSSRRAESP